MRYYLLFIIVSFGLSTLSAHDIHVSVTEIAVSENGKIEVSVRIFFDDLLLACGLKPGEELPQNYSSSDDLIKDFLSKYFKFYVDKEKLKLKYKESNLGQLAVWVDLEAVIPNYTNLTEIHIENTILLDQFDDQLNMVHFESPDGPKKSHILDHNNKRAKLD